MKKNNKGSNTPKALVYVYASMADIVLLANEMKKDDNSVKLDQVLLEYLLFSHFGFDKTSTVFHEGWYESEVLEHIPKLSHKRVVCERFVGAERLDDDWFNTGLMSDNAWKIYRGV